MAEAVEIATERLLLVSLPPEDAGRVLAYYERNREHLANFEPARPASFYTLAHWQQALSEAGDALRAGAGVRVYAVRKEDPRGSLVAQVALNNLVRGVFQAGHLGYSVDHACQGQGLMSEAVEAMVQYAFRTLGLHRVMANYLPENERSGRLLRGLGFRVEGYAHDYLKIAGRWRDHILTARINPHEV